MVIFICQSVLFQFLGSIEKVIMLFAILYNLLKHSLCNICLLRLQNCFQVASSYYCTTYYNHEVRYPEYYYHYYLGVIMTYSSPDFCAQYKQVAHNQKSIGYDVVPGSRAQIVCCTGAIGPKYFYSHTKDGFYSESAICFSNLPISKIKIFQKTIMSLKFEFVVYYYWQEI